MSQTDNFEIIENPEEELLDFSDSDENSYDNTRDEVLKDIIPSFTSLIETIYDEIYQKTLDPLLDCDCYNTDKNTDVNKIDELKKIINELENKCLVETENNDSLRKSIESLNETYRTLVEENNYLLYQNSQISSKNTQYETDITNLNFNITELHKKCNTLVGDNTAIESKNTDLEFKYNLLFTDFEKLRKTNDILNVSLKESESGELMLQKQLENCIDSIKESHSTIKELKEKIKILEENQDTTKLDILAEVCSQEHKKKKDENEVKTNRYNLRSRKLKI